MVIVAIDSDPAKSGELEARAKDHPAALHLRSRHGGCHVDFMTGDEGEARARAACGSNHERPREIERRYDPMKLFRMNRDVAP